MKLLIAEEHPVLFLLLVAAIFAISSNLMWVGVNHLYPFKKPENKQVAQFSVYLSFACIFLSWACIFLGQIRPMVTPM
ncbi:hypothetical protein NEFER03_1575 [Nematocida sp. LUAm3]|nr:hypothetical protein NEFER03_1575 [Nematocida sp. LUAm3]KAI5174651.1 hypothetical protein NEFER02_0761 [Nematocida sp. LUAm2]KAI5177788.1 hypothetical protein NEFER01_0990 [Nematocida sp. LUAm1]